MPIIKKSRILVFPKPGKKIIIFSTIAFIIAGVYAYRVWSFVFKSNIKTEKAIIIPENATISQVTDSLIRNDILLNYKAFIWGAKRKKYGENIRPERYFFKKRMNTNQVINILRGGLQFPVKVTFNNVRTKEDLAGKVSRYIEADSLSILNLFYNENKIKEFGFTPETFKSMFIPNTYEFYWTTSAAEFADRMKDEYDRFWNETRLKKAEEIGLSPVEVICLASIVQAETAKNSELKRVAGLYINRLKRGQLLQADPTVKYAVGDFSLKRILNSHLEVDSPYNTYKYAGLPPGPINFPEINAIDAVLDYEKHEYIYMCAKEDFSGYHNFAKTLAQHNRNAEIYWRKLNENRIR